jgi:hypothetical protein
MLRKVLAAVFCLGVCLTMVTADEFKGKIKSVDPDKKTITVDVDGKDMTFKVTADTKYMAGKKDLAEGLAAKQFGKTGGNVTVKTADGNKDTAQEIRVGGGKKKQQ